MNKPILTFYKKAEKSTNKIRIPKAVIQSYGDEFLMEVHEDKIILVPIKNGGK